VKARRLDWRLLLSAAAIAGLFVLDLQLPRDLQLLPPFWLPVLLATAFATPAQVIGLSLVALVFAIAAGLHFYHVAEVVYWERLLFLAGVSLLAIHLSMRRQQIQRQLVLNEERYRLLAENATDVVFRIDSSARLEWISSSVEALLGWSVAELIGRSILSLIHPDDIEVVQQSWQVCNSSDIRRMRHRIVNRQGEAIWVSVSCRAISDTQGQLIGRIGSWSDARAEVRALHQLTEQRQLLETVLDHVDSHIYMKDAEHRYRYANLQVQQLFGRGLDDIVGRSDRDFFSGEGLEAMWRFDEEVLRSGRHVQREECIPDANGQPRWFLSNKLTLRQNGDLCVIGFATDITERKQAEQELERSESKFRLLFEASLDAIMLVDAAGRFMDANPATLQLFGVPDRETFLRCGPMDFSPEFQSNGERSAELISVNIARTLEQGSHQLEWLHRRLDNGEPFLCQVTLKAIILNGQPALMSVARDISEARRYEERLRVLAYRDGLTGLPNRAASLEHLQQRLAEVGPAGALVVVNLDFDRFQAVNDSFGLVVGNRVLTTAAAVLRQWLRPDDWLARLESDEFLVIRSLPAADGAAARRFGQELQQALAAGLAAQDDLPIQPSTSAGLAFAPEHCREPVALLQAANTALMEAKRHSQNTVWLYQKELSAAIQQLLDLELKLKQAIERQQLQLVFQPEVNRNGQLIGAEALLRWTLADGTTVCPEVFIPLAEQTGLIHSIGEWVMETACAQLASWQRQGLRLPRMAINLSPVQFENRETELDAWLMGVLSRHGIAPFQLELEVTETALLRDPKRASHLLVQLGAAGFRIAIDDFGTGYSSLVNLHTLPVHKLKIDKSFVQRITDNGSERAIIDSTLVIARKLSLETMAEGVETDAQWQILKQLGCDSFQGHLFGRAMSAVELGERLRQS
jgi:diguanylate cyclase (GGDEF)-like protein/PAS domain S-box-containing protein